MVEDEGIQPVLVCIFSLLEPGRAFSFKFEKGRPFVESAKRKCQLFYFYFIDRDLGSIIVKLPIRRQKFERGSESLQM